MWFRRKYWANLLIFRTWLLKKESFVIPALFLMLFFSVISSHGQSNLQYLSSTTGAACYAIEYSNGYLYAGAGNTLTVFDANSPIPYLNYFEHRFASNIAHIEAHANRLYVCANHDGLSVWDLSAPAQPVLLDQYVPDSLNQAAYHLAFYGDTIFVAYKTMMAVFYFNSSSNSLQLQNTFALQTGNSLVRGVAVKNNLLAFTTAYGQNSQTGIHIWDIPTMAELSFYEQDFADPENVLFSINAPILNVLGGTESWQNGNPKGLFYALEVSDPTLPLLIHSDTLGGGVNFFIASPMNGCIVNDTLYVATMGMSDSLSAAGDTAGYVYVYDVHGPATYHFITNINAGLWHFDVAVANSKLYVASEWYGVKTIDISDVTMPVDLGLTLTGGWNCAADKHGNRLVVAQEGFGFKHYDISDLTHPVLLGEVVTVGFCYGIHYDKTGNYIFSFNYTDDDFRVYRSSDLVQVSSLNPNSGLVITDYYKEEVWQDKALAIQKPTFLGIGSKSVISYDVSDVNNPFVDTVLSPAGTVEDIEVNASGKLFVSTTSHLYVYDMANNYQQLADVPVTLFQQFHDMAVCEDTVYVYVSGLNPGIEKYAYNGTTSLMQVGGTFALTFDGPEYLAADAFGLYLDYQEEGLFAFDKNTVTPTGYYKHGLEFFRPTQWGQRGLFCRDSLIFLVEYFGQTSILSNYDSLDLGIPHFDRWSPFEVFPNPSTGMLCISNPGSPRPTYELYGAVGALLLQVNESGTLVKINISSLPAGIYYLKEVPSGLVKKIIRL